MTALNPRQDLPRTEATPELRRLLGLLQNGDALSIVEHGVVVGELRRVLSQRQETDIFARWSDAGLIGCAKGVPRDASTDPRHMRGFGS
jgi:hypothetical protein